MQTRCQVVGLTLCLLVSSVYNLCKQFELRSGPTKHRASSASNLFDGTPEQIFRKSILKKNQQTTKSHEQIPSVQS